MRSTAISAVVCVAIAGLAGTGFWYDHSGRRLSLNRDSETWKNRLKAWEPERFDQPQEAEDFFIQKRVPGGAGPLDYSLYTAAMTSLQKNQQYSITTGAIIANSSAPLGSWTFLGPGNIGGRTRGIVIDPTNTQIMYSAAVAGGVWKTTNGGGTWSATSDFLPNIAVNSLVMDPNNHLILYAGTGEGYFNGDSQRGNGIYKTTNGGTTWTQLAFTNNNPDFYYVNKMVLNAASTRLYAATRTGLFRSLDGGTTWSKTLDATSINGCMDVKVQTDRPLARVFAACGTFTQAKISRALDGNGTLAWNTVWSPTNMGRTTLALAPSNQNTIYALSASNANNSYNQGLLAVYRSVDSGTTWTTQVSNTFSTTDPVPLSNLLLSNPVYGFNQCVGSAQFLNQGWYDNILAVDPVNANTVWVSGIDNFRSTDGGATWGVASYWFAPTNNPVYSHADHHALVFDPNYNGTTNQILFDGNDGGIFKTANAVSGNVGTTVSNVCGTVVSSPVSWTNLNNSYGVTQFYYGVPFPDGTAYFGGAQDNGTKQGSDGGGPNAWTSNLGGDGGAVAVNPANLQMAWGEFTGNSIVRTVNGWGSNVNFNTGISDSGFQFIAPFVQDALAPTNMWTGGTFIWRTTQATAASPSNPIWTQASTSLSGGVSSLAVAPTSSNTVYVGTTNGRVYYNTSALSATSSTTWSSAVLQSGCYVAGLAVDPSNPTTAWAVTSTFQCPHVWKTTNGGVSWTAMNGTNPNTIPDIPAHTIAINPSNGSKLYLGTDLGVFVSVDGGANWLVENNFQLPNVIVDSLTFNTTGTIQLFAFTHGRGAWKVTPQ